MAGRKGNLDEVAGRGVGVYSDDLDEYAEWANVTLASSAAAQRCMQRLLSRNYTPRGDRNL